MEQNKKSIVIAVVVTAVVVIGLGAGGLFAYTQLNKKVVLNNGAASIESSTLAANASSSLSNDSSSPSSLSVSDSTSSGTQSLGQLGGSTSTGAQGSTQGNSSNSSNSQSPDPASFSQYDQYKSKTEALFGDIKVGSGATVGQTSKVAVYYKGWLTNGQMFDQSRTGSDGKLQPFVFTMGQHQVITGWEQAIYGMKVGGTRLIVVPPAVGYGNTAQGSIPPNSVLVFEVQLLDLQ